MIKINLLACLAVLSLIPAGISAMLRPLFSPATKTILIQRSLIRRWNSDLPCQKNLACCKDRLVKEQTGCEVENAKKRAEEYWKIQEQLQKERKNKLNRLAPYQTTPTPAPSPTVSTDALVVAAAGYLVHKVLHPENSRHNDSPSTIDMAPSYTPTSVYSTRQDSERDPYHEPDVTHHDSGDTSE